MTESMRQTVRKRSLSGPCNGGYQTDNGISRFRADLEEAFGVATNPKRQRLFEIAWEQGRASGYYEVFQHYADLVTLIK